jgi:GDP-4-dehydro-6-deoxy-D-mannose reductase
MQKYLITGFSGFVAKHFLDYLETNNIEAKILGVDICQPEIYATYKNIQWSFELVDLLNQNTLEALILSFQPEYILHLASFSSVAFSWQNPAASFMNNTNIFLNILEIIRTGNLNCRIISVGSSEEYGNVSASDVPLKEDRRLEPVSPYAVASVSQAMLSKVYAKAYGLDIVRTRSFNHIGPGQKETFVISSFARQIVSLKKNGEQGGSITAGNISIVRDFLDVRDVVVAYYKLFQYGKSGEVYNICTGIGVSLKEIIHALAETNNVKIAIHVNNKLLRPDDNQIIVGDNTKIKEQTDWMPGIPLKQSLRDISDYWLEK